MDPRTNKELIFARKVALAGAIVMVLFSVVTFIVVIVVYLAYRQVGITETYSSTWWLRSILSASFAFASLCSLARFLLLFSSSNRSNFRKLSNALLVSGVTILARQACSSGLKPLKEEIFIITDPIPIALIPGDSAPIRMLPIAFAVFLLCVIALLRYMEDLREDSESIV